MYTVDLHLEDQDCSFCTVVVVVLMGGGGGGGGGLFVCLDLDLDLDMYLAIFISNNSYGNLININSRQ